MTVPPVVRLFSSHAAARDAIMALEQAGIDKDDISVLARSPEEAHELARETGAEDDLEDATARRGPIRDLMDWFGSIGAALPGFGPLVGTGNLGLEAARAGSGPGAITGALVGAGIDVDEAQSYENEVMDGQILVLVHSRNQAVARQVLDQQPDSAVGN